MSTNDAKSAMADQAETAPDAAPDVALPTTTANDGPKTLSSSTEAEKASVDPTPTKQKRQWPASLGWVQNSLNFQAMKPVIRCWITLWVGLIFILVLSVERWLGNAAFFLMIVTFINPPADPLVPFVESMLIMLIGAGLGYGWASLAMVAALKARSPLTQAQAQAAIQAAAPTIPNAQSATNPELQQAAVFNGGFLDTKSTIVFAVFLFVGVFVATIVKAKYPRLQIACIFSIIIMDVICTYGPLFPAFQNLGTLFIIPMCIYAAFGIVMELLVFPESVNKQFTDNVPMVINAIQASMEGQLKLLQTSPQSNDFASMNVIAAQRPAAIAGYQKLLQIKGNLSREISYSRFSSKDLKKIEIRTQKLITPLTGFQLFFDILNNGFKSSRTTEDLSSEKQGDDLDKEVDESATKEATQADDGHQKHNKLHRKPHLPDSRNASKVNLKPVGVIQTAQMMHLREEAESEHRRQAMLDILALTKDASTPLLETVIQCLKATSARLLRMNGRGQQWNPFSSIPKAQLEKEMADYQKEIGGLDQQIQTYLVKRLDVLKPYQSHVESNDHDHDDEKHESYRSLYVAFIFEFNLLCEARNLKDLMSTIHDLERQRTKAKFWLPTIGFDKFLDQEVTDALDYDGAYKVKTEEDDKSEDTDSVTEKESYTGTRNVDYVPGTRKRHKVAATIDKVRSFFGNGTFEYAIKNSILNIALAIPSFIPSTAGFIYREKGLWALLMAVLVFQQYSGDNIFHFVIRTIGTVFGLALGLIIWYIGQGNPYGLAAICAVMFFILMFARVKGPLTILLPVMMIGTSVVLIIGYSWQDQTIGQLIGNVGEGWPVAWRRILLVIIGFLAAFIMMFIPYPRTGRRELRRLLSKTIPELGDLHVMALSQWLKPGGVDATLFRRKLMDIAARMQGAGMRLVFAKFEPSLRGDWPADKYAEIVGEVQTINNLLGQCAIVLLHMNPEWRQGLIKKTPFLEPRFLSDLSTTYYLIASALETGAPLPQLTPSPLVARAMQNNVQMRQKRLDNPLDNLPADGHFDTPVGNTFDEHDHMNFDVLRDEQFMVFTVGIVTSMALFGTLDKLMLTVKELTGEAYEIRGIEQLVQSREQV